MSYFVLVTAPNGNSSNIFQHQNGFARGVQPDYIVGATGPRGNLSFVVKFNDGSSNLVSSAELKSRCPHLLIVFYEKNIVFDN